MAHCSGPMRLLRNVSPTWLALPFLLLSVAGSSAVLGADDYLDAISVEADKVGAEPSKAADPATDSADESSNPMQAFEKQLEDRFAGTYLFYKRLPPESREEIFRQFKGGAPIEDVRRTIMSRFLHTR
jgi:hypothetical protein